MPPRLRSPPTASKRALVLEARDRIGGRIWTQREPGLPSPIELGAEFIHGRVPATFELLRATGHVALDAPEKHFSLRRGSLQRLDHALFAQMQRALARVGSRTERHLLRGISRRQRPVAPKGAASRA